MDDMVMPLMRGKGWISLPDDDVGGLIIQAHPPNGLMRAIIIINQAIGIPITTIIL